MAAYQKKCRYRTGCIYAEVTNDGRHRSEGGMSSVRYVRTVGMVPGRKHRWVGEISINGKRHRFRSTNRMNVVFFIREMVMKYGEY